ncbi:MAG: AAA family ATPase [Pseudomonadota bacterium]
MAVDQSISEARLNDETLSELGLTEQPFVENKKLARFSDTTTQKLRASLEQKLRFGQSVHLLTGEQGVGKSVFLSQLFKHCKDNLKPFVAKGDDNFSSLAFLAAVQHQLAGEAEEYESVHDYVADLAPLFESLADDKMGVVLAIDDAHHAPVEEIAELINLMPEFVSDTDDATARLLLVGEPVLIEDLNTIEDQLDQSVYDGSTITFDALDESRIPDYLSSRLKQAGFTDAFPFTDKAITKIQRETNGLPGQINHRAADYLNKVYTTAPARVGDKGFFAALGWPLVALGTAAVGLIAWGLSMFFTGSGPEPGVSIDNQVVATESSDSTIVAADTDSDAGNSDTLIIDSDPLAASSADTDTSNDALIVNNVDTQPAVVDDLLKPEDQPIAEVATDIASNAGNNVGEAIDNAADNVTETVAGAASDTTETVTQIVEAPTEAVEAVTDTASNAVASAQDTLENATDQGSELLETVNDTVNQRAQQITAEAETIGITVEDDARITSEQIAQTIGQGTAQALPESVEVVVPAAVSTVADNTAAQATDSDAAAVSSNDNGGIDVPVQPVLTDSNGQALDTDAVDAVPAIQRAVENERWVLFQDAGKFTVQLATSREREYIIDLAQSLPATDPVAIYPFLTTNSKNPVFGLLSGLYDTREEAVVAVENMPQAAKQFGVWIRPIGDLQGDIKAQK